MDVSENSGTPKSSILIRCSIINRPFGGTPIFGNIQVEKSREKNTCSISRHLVVLLPILLGGEKPPISVAFLLTPWILDMEHNHGGSEEDDFPFQRELFFLGSILIFRGVTWGFIVFSKRDLGGTLGTSAEFWRHTPLPISEDFGWLFFQNSTSKTLEDCNTLPKKNDD